MFLGAFERVFKGLQKTGLNRLRPVNVNRFFLRSLHFKNKKTGPQVRSFAVLVRSGYGLFPVMRPDFQTLTAIEAHRAYALQQAAMYRDLKQHCEHIWHYVDAYVQVGYGVVVPPEVEGNDDAT